MNRAIITWDPDVVRLDDASLSKHPALSSTGYYAVLSARLDTLADVWHDLELAYIGESFTERLRRSMPTAGAVRDRLVAHLDERTGKQLVVMLGLQTSTSLKRVTRGFTSDVLRCLVTRHEPPCNGSYEGPYTGRKISVINRGDFRPLKPKCLLRPEV